MYPKLILKSGKDQSLRRYHPWVFSGAVKKIKGDIAEGDLIQVFDNKDEYLGIGHYNDGSIMVRMLSFSEDSITDEFWKRKVEEAWALRKRLELTDGTNTNVFRLINAEGDGLPGLIADYYNGTVVMQKHSIGIHMNSDQIVKAIKDVLGEKLEAIYDKSEATLPAKLEVKNSFLYGKVAKGEVSEYGNLFNIDWKKGQKTGFFIDQRENRKLLEKYSKDAKVLNMFGYTGGFSVYAMRGGAEKVHSVDSSAKAIDLTKENIKLNFGQDKRHEAYAVDAFKFLDDIKDKYDIIILDPPAFAKHHNVLHNALQGYKKLNAKAIEQIQAGVIIYTFSCSQVVSKENFRKSVFAAAANTGRRVRVLHQLTQPADHPVSIYHPEGEYLKGLVLQVD